MKDYARKKGFTLIELLVVISIIAVLMSIMMPAMSKAREQARGVICASNLNQWGLIFSLYTNDYNGYYPRGWYTKTEDAQLWMSSLRGLYGDISEIRCCASAKNPDKNGGVWGTWGPFPEYTGTYMEKEDYGSYGINEWIYYNDGVANLLGASNKSAQYHWNKTDQKKSSNIPVLLDSGTYEIAPAPTDKPPTVEGEYRWAEADPMGEMGRCTFYRHKDGINMLFMDSSVRRVELRDLWYLDWRRDWKVARKPIYPSWMEK